MAVHDALADWLQQVLWPLRSVFRLDDLFQGCRPAGVGGSTSHCTCGATGVCSKPSATLRCLGMLNLNVHGCAGATEGGSAACRARGACTAGHPAACWGHRRLGCRWWVSMASGIPILPPPPPPSLLPLTPCTAGGGGMYSPAPGSRHCARRPMLCRRSAQHRVPAPLQVMASSCSRCLRRCCACCSARLGLRLSWPR